MCLEKPANKRWNDQCNSVTKCVLKHSSVTFKGLQQNLAPNKVKEITCPATNQKWSSMQRSGKIHKEEENQLRETDSEMSQITERVDKEVKTAIRNMFLWPRT